ncbi:hypothetical protein Ahy_B10g101083 isoform B [Arachis hypogaea]|uniref:SWIM-type domain-containing protein n=1 Tax=Arachis hypogaea TaxID=3818 RepID=A0A444WYH5_ARAHY|nr:hypothetical protein Ahy_B10g101083 isoform B [Arachis hypogaea]
MCRLGEFLTTRQKTIHPDQKSMSGILLLEIGDDLFLVTRMVSTSKWENKFYRTVSLSQEDADRGGSDGDAYDVENSELEDLAGLSVNNILKKAWDNVDNAYEFYRGFKKLHGFGVRKGDSGKDCEGNLVRYMFFCNKEGFRERKHYDRVDRMRVHKPETRTNCKAMLSVYLDKNDKYWKVRKLVTEHNHDLTPAGMVHLIANHHMMTDVFESEWEQAAEDYGLCQKQWWCQMYEKKEMWASAYLRDKFWAGYRTTSHCEGINTYVNKFSKSTHTILELVQCLDLVAREYRNKEMLLQFKSINSVPVMTTCLRSLERHAASVYTREVFDVKKEIEGAGALILISTRRIMNTMIYTLEEYEDPDVHIMSSFGRSTRKLSCLCNFWKKQGYPCKHMFFVMKAEHLKEIPEKIVLRRWRTDAKSAEHERGVILGHGALHSASQWLFFLGAQRLSMSQKAMRGIESLCKELEMDCRAFGSSMRRNEEKVGEGNPVVRDPVVAKAKSAPKLPTKKHLGKRRRCTGCKGIGHNKRNYPMKGRRMWGNNGPGLMSNDEWKSIVGT